MQVRYQHGMSRIAELIWGNVYPSIRRICLFGDNLHVSSFTHKDPWMYGGKGLEVSSDEVATGEPTYNFERELHHPLRQGGA